MKMAVACQASFEERARHGEPISEEDKPKFVEATQEEWQEWLKWSSCKAIYPQPGEVDPKLILKSRICYRWKPKDGGEWFKPKSRIVVLGFADSTTAESRCSSPGKDIPGPHHSMVGISWSFSMEW